MRKLDRPAHDRLDFRRLIDEPEAALRKLCGWLELDFDPRMATNPRVQSTPPLQA